MKKYNIIFWIVTGFIVAFDSLIPAFTSNTQLAIDGIRHLGYPDYFRHELTIFKILGGIVLIFPRVPGRIKEWAYAGFGINFLSAFIAQVVVDGFGGMALFPLFMLVLLVISYVCRKKLHDGAAYERRANIQIPAHAM